MTSGAGGRPRVAVLFGGRSSEHQISCITAAGVLGAIDSEKYDVLPIGVTRDGRWVPVGDEVNDWQLGSGGLPQVPEHRPESLLLTPVNGRAVLLNAVAGEVVEDLGEVDVVFPLFHGPYGEDGTIQGYLELAQIRYVGAGILASAIGMDKEFMKRAFTSAGFEIGPYQVVTHRDWTQHREQTLGRLAELGWPVFVKPARAGSSVGISRATSEQELIEAIDLARAEDPKVIVEAAITGREIECGVLQGRDGAAPRTTLPGEIVTTGGHDLYDFEAKYLDDQGAELSCPADLPEEAILQIREQAAGAFEAIGAEGLSRVDFFYTDDGRVLINEINTMPGFTSKSMYPYMWSVTGVAYPELVDELLQLALSRAAGLR
ncbi:D-alanine--D-alanine ligase [Acaricomes phytoseiuli]|nr:D-alanine--D-alanine ligase [Acaricomes phytoseiuli]